MTNLIITPSSKLKGAIRVAPDKSISHRIIMCGAIAHGETVAMNFLNGEDCLATIDCFKKMGVEIKIEDYLKSGTHVCVKGKGIKGLSMPENMLYVGNSGTTIRVLSGILAGQAFTSTITGDASIEKRPMKRVIDPLSKMGARIHGKNNTEFAPLTIMGTDLKSITYNMPIASAQVKSAILFAGLYADGITTVVEPMPSRDHTERILKLFGANIKRNGNAISIEGKASLKSPEIFSVPADISAAAYFMAAAAIVSDAEILIREVGVNPTRNGIIEVMHRMGAKITVLDEDIVFAEPKADILVKNSSLEGIEIGGEIIPRLIDELPIIAVLATQAKGTTIIKDAKELRVKESDRIATMAGELRKMGAKIIEQEDGMIIEGPTKLKGAKVDSHGDHRVAMSLAIAGLAADGQTTVENADCIKTSFPNFEEILQSIV